MDMDIAFPESDAPDGIGRGFDMSWCRNRGAGSGSPDHYHDYFEFFLFLGDSMRYFIKDRTYEVGRNNIVLIGRNTFHHSIYPAAGRNERLLVCFDERLFVLAGGERARERVEPLFRGRAATLPADIGERVSASLLRDVYPEYRQHGGQAGIGRMRAMLRVVDLFLELAELDERRLLTDIEPAETTKAGGRIRELVRYINENYAEKISLEAMSAVFYLNKYYMCHVFKKCTGLGIVEFTNRKRLSEAARMLRSTSEPITAIAMSVGFNSVNHFTGLFRRMHGMTPGEYRRLHAARA